MAGGEKDLYGNAPDKSPVAMLLIDVINDLDFDDGAKLLKQAMPMARAIARLRKQAHAAQVPVIYVNDNFGHWQSDFRKQVRHCLEDGVRGEPIARLLKPDPQDYFVLKPKHSGFFSTQLEILLTHLGVQTLVIAGMAANICVLFTANDAYMLGYELIVPADAVASNTKRENGLALAQMRDVLKAETPAAAQIDFRRLKRGVRQPSHRAA